MAIGKGSRKSSSRGSMRAPKFLDKSSGFYGRLDEPETTAEGEEVKGSHVEDRGKDSEDGHTERRVSATGPGVVHSSGAHETEEAEAFDFSDGAIEDDGETLLSRKPNRLSSKWRRSSRRKHKDSAQDESPATVVTEEEEEVEKVRKMEEENEKMGRGKEPALVHFQVREDEDDQVLIRDKKRAREEDERGTKAEQDEGLKMLKGASTSNYRKTLDRALRRGWETFITNLYSVTLAPAAPSSPSSPSLKKKSQHNAVLAEFR